jgi:hypothetical protein
VFVRETDNLLGVLRNAAHLFRVLGRENTGLVLEILTNEEEITESSFDLLYQVVQAGERCVRDGLEMVVPIQGVYEYAGFFLNTLGGRSYLLRRSSRIRMLLQYYSMLALDEANQRNLNGYGLDIRGHVDLLMKDMRGSANLIWRAEYMRRLEGLRDSYGSLYGRSSEPSQRRKSHSGSAEG